MNKKLFALIALVCSLSLFSSCGGDDDNKMVVDEDWKAYNEKQEADVKKAGSGYTTLSSESKNGDVYWKAIDYYAVTEGKSTKMTHDGYPYISDSIAIRYQRFYYNRDGSKNFFDPVGGDNNRKITYARISSYSDIDGFATMLQHMKVGDLDQVEVCIPSALGYGAMPKYDSQGINVVVPAYTTLWYRIYLVDVYPDNPGEFD